MFTGIVERTGTVRATYLQVGGKRLAIEVGSIASELAEGASLSVNGACLTVAAIHPPIAEFDVIEETLNRTNLGRLQTGDRVNLERSLRVGDRLGGYFVQGHIDSTARLVSRQAARERFLLWFEADEQLMAYIAPKGSVVIDGVALTVVDVAGRRFSVALIPTTLERTTLQDRLVGDLVNVETDLIARIIARQLKLRTNGGMLTMDKLKTLGFA